MKPRQLSKFLLKFVVSTLLLCAALMALWWIVALDHVLPVLLGAVEWLSRLIFGTTIEAIVENGEMWDIHTTLRVQGQPDTQLVIAIAPRRFTTSVPFFCALVLATPASRWCRNLLVGNAVLWPAIVMMLVLFIHSMLGQYLNRGAEAPGALVLEAEPYHWFVYQLTLLEGDLAGLVFPILVPVLIWAVLNPAMFRRDVGNSS